MINHQIISRGHDTKTNGFGGILFGGSQFSPCCLLLKPKPKPRKPRSVLNEAHRFFRGLDITALASPDLEIIITPQ